MYREKYVNRQYDLLDQVMVYCPILNSVVSLLIIIDPDIIIRKTKK